MDRVDELTQEADSMHSEKNITAQSRREAERVNTDGLDQTLRYGWNDLTPNQKIAIGQMQETINSLNIRIRGYERANERQAGCIDMLREQNSELIDKMIIALDKTGRL